MRFLIDLDGSVLKSELVKSSGYPLLDTAALDALSKCQFTTPNKGTATEPSWAPVQYVWSLK